MTNDGIFQSPCSNASVPEVYRQPQMVNRKGAVLTLRHAEMDAVWMDGGRGFWRVATIKKNTANACIKNRFGPAY